MPDRNFSEVDLRTMLEDAYALERDIRPGRWRVLSKRDGWPWEIIVEPNFDRRVIAVITAYRLH